MRAEMQRRLDSIGLPFPFLDFCDIYEISHPTRTNKAHVVWAFARWRMIACAGLMVPLGPERYKAFETWSRSGGPKECLENHRVKSTR
jgi:hypothetical protein